MRAARKQLGRFGCAFDVLPGNAGDKTPWQVLEQTYARALRREMQVARRGGTDGGRVDVQVEHVGNELRRCSRQIDALDAAGNLRLGGFAEFQFVEDVAGDPVVPVGIPQSVERTGWIVRAWRRQFLMPCLQAESRRHRRKARVERHHLDFEAAFLFLVGEFLPDADGRGIGRIGKSDLVMVIVGGARPEADGVDRRGIRPVFALGGEFGLMAVDPRLVIGAVDAGNAIKRVVLRDRSADEATLEDVRAADRSTIRLHRRIRLPAVDWPGLVEQIGIARDAVVAGLATIGVGVKCKIAAAGIEQDTAIDTPVDRIDRRSRFDIYA